MRQMRRPLFNHDMRTGCDARLFIVCRLDADLIGTWPHGVFRQDVVIKVADEGGGIQRSYMNRIWSYLFTTADPAVQEGFVNVGQAESDHAKESPLAGLG